MTLQEAATLAGHHAWWEQRLFELAGAWAVADPRSEVTVVLAGQANRHAARAEAWHRRLPVLAGWDAEMLTVAPAGPREDRLAELAASDAPSEVRLAAFYLELLPSRTTAYTTHLERTSDVCDGPARRVLHGILAVLPAEIHAGEALLRS